MPINTPNDRTAVSIVIPVYNEEESILPLYQSVCRACDLMREPYEVIFVDDGSRDKTFDILKRIHEHDARLKVLSLRKNSGQTAAMAAGFEYAAGSLIVSMDGELQNDPVDIPRLVSKVREDLICCGWKSRQDKLWTRRLPSVMANWIIGRVTGVKSPIMDVRSKRRASVKTVALYGDAPFHPRHGHAAGARPPRTVTIIIAMVPGKYGISRV
jgi:glycosyltransferase involved in cell wall biosynthesis